MICRSTHSSKEQLVDRVRPTVIVERESRPRRLCEIGASDFDRSRLDLANDCQGSLLHQYSPAHFSPFATPTVSLAHDCSLPCCLRENQCDNNSRSRFVQAHSPRPRLRIYLFLIEYTFDSSICSLQQPGEDARRVHLVVWLVLRDHTLIPSSVYPPNRITSTLPRLQPHILLRTHTLPKDIMPPTLCQGLVCRRTFSQKDQSLIPITCILTQMGVLTSAPKFVLPSTLPSMTTP